MDLVLAIEIMGGLESVSDNGVLSTQFTGVAAAKVRIRAYNANREISTTRDPLLQGTRVFLTCDVTDLPEDSEMNRYRWFRNCTGGAQGSCEIHEPVPYYRAVKGTLWWMSLPWTKEGSTPAL